VKWRYYFRFSRFFLDELMAEIPAAIAKIIAGAANDNGSWRSLYILLVQL